jgi:hypothetical protein
MKPRRKYSRIWDEEIKVVIDDKDKIYKNCFTRKEMKIK